MSDRSIQDFATALKAMSEDEVFMTLAGLERKSDATNGSVQADIFARIALTEEEIEARFPGQVLTPYRVWKQRQPII